MILSCCYTFLSVYKSKEESWDNSYFRSWWLTLLGHFLKQCVANQVSCTLKAHRGSSSYICIWVWLELLSKTRCKILFNSFAKKFSEDKVAPFSFLRQILPVWFVPFVSSHFSIPLPISHCVSGGAFLRLAALYMALPFSMSLCVFCFFNVRLSLCLLFFTSVFISLIQLCIEYHYSSFISLKWIYSIIPQYI